jgi:hypothetical protein
MATRMLCIVYWVNVAAAYLLIVVIEITQTLRGDYGRSVVETVGPIASINALLSTVLSLIIRQRKPNFGCKWIWIAIGALCLILGLPKL